MSTQDQQWMSLAIDLARRGIAQTHPNPRVGAVVVANGQCVGQGWHRRAGAAHAEVEALSDAREKAKGATLYVSLEPCSAFGRTPPCTEAILAAGIARVVYASPDPNPKMAGGAALLRKAGIEVKGCVCRQRADALNRPFFHLMQQQRPYVTAKAAISLDGKLACHTGHSQWISGARARKHAHALRARADAIVIGKGTFVADNPSLTVREARLCGNIPKPVVVCDVAPAVFASELLQSEEPARMYVLQHNEDSRAWQDVGLDVVQCGDLEAILLHLAKDGYLSIMLEGGGRCIGSFLDAGLVDEMVLYQAPIFIGGVSAPGLWHAKGIGHLSEAMFLDEMRCKRLGRDMMIRGLLTSFG